LDILVRLSAAAAIVRPPIACSSDKG